MSAFDIPDLPSQFRQVLGKCRELYVSSGEQVASENPRLLDRSPTEFIQLMDDLHRALAIKVFVSICESDRRWSKQEKFLAEVLLFHLWGQWVTGQQLQQAIAEMSDKALALKWYALVRPFDMIAPLRNRVAELETIVSRMANIVARADGPLSDVKSGTIKSIQEELYRQLRQIPIDEPGEHREAERAGSQAIEKIFDKAEILSSTRPDKVQEKIALPPLEEAKIKIAEAEAEPPKSNKTPAEQLAEALAELDKLVGLATVKEEVRTLANFLKVQEKRKAAGLPTSALSLHMVFGGNPGTGKTTVARIVGKIFGAMGILKKGHLIETDRSGLVAEYAGQTGPKSHKKIDEALDGVLFIDEAYTLIASEGEDPFGHEAVQTLLKRMEDDRDRLVVVLAGYPFEMELLLNSNPGLESRFSRQLDFPDYRVLELCQIFGLMCDKNRYLVGPPVRAKTIAGFDWLHDRRTRTFGNGRTVRNLFEDAIRRQANRIAEIAELSVEQLSTLEAEDIVIKECPADELAPAAIEKLKFSIACPQCQHAKSVRQKFLGQKVRCPKCNAEFLADWGELAVAESTSQVEKSAEKSASAEAPPTDAAN